MHISMPVSDSLISELKINDTVKISGVIYCGRDAVLPKIVKLIDDGKWDEKKVNLNGTAIFHTAVSPAGIGPTSSNKLDIESSIPELSKAGVKLHIGKGSLSKETVEALKKYNSIFLVTPPNTALLTSKIKSKEVVAFKEQGMEAFTRIDVVDFPAIVAIAHGKSIFDK
ncbi:fumarate hydratase C-terminal domain-containing protein [Sedimentibacter sp. MB31-C6]|uniref:fumarate hydratase C-terminal domain-containing protein n=1 Tax=Sedimentibacter sp. MB31-C6 TaxID=3109366 RepID=UPI002DDD994F|nr:fumarate hydratase C-terminal domain-containing protein [Sedimentibacter sp. MB36-C1]WSI03384.1 fumarate hydratase C-terminal domain-containing protein [Sedimentibacter sp. MB36-C1]